MTATLSPLPGRSVRDRVSPEEWAARVELACAYRIADHHGWTHMVYNHISSKIPGTQDRFLINPFGFMFREITASSLVKVDLEGNIQDDSPHEVIRAGWIIHSAVHATRPEVICVWHTHTLDGMAVGAQKDGLLPLNMGALHFYNRIGYHDYEGPSIDTGERQRLATALGKHDALILRNHGLLTCGTSIGDTFHTMFQLEKACSTQVATLAGGRELHLPPLEVCKHSEKSSERPNRGLDLVWAAYRRLADELYPGYRD